MTAYAAVQENSKFSGLRAPQIPLSKPLKTKRLQAVPDWDSI
jgi:hypothetical protein